MNLERINHAIEDHNARCPFGGVAVAVLLNPFELKRLGWDEIRGIPIEAESSVPTGRIRIRCSAGDHSKEPAAVAEVDEREVVHA